MPVFNASGGSRPSGRVPKDPRLLELLELQSLDTRPELRFTRYTHLVMQLCGVSTAVISLRDGRRELLEKRWGVSLPETGIELAFCQCGVAGDGLLVIEDALDDEQFRSNTLVVGDPSMRFYAGAVLRAPNGRPLGAMCALDTEPRRLTENQLAGLINIARMVEEEIAFNVELGKARGHFTSLSHRDLSSPATTHAIANERLDELISVGLPTRGALGVIHLEIKNLKEIERAHGAHLARDALSEWLAGLQEGGVYYSARLSENEFMVVIRCSTSVEDVRTRSEAWLCAIGQSVHVHARKVDLDVKAGMSIYPSHGDSAEQLIDKAKRAQYAAVGPSHLEIYDDSTEAQLVRRARILARFEALLSGEGISYNLQPISDSHTGCVVGFELLASWTDLELGDVPPEEFVPVVETNDRLRSELTQSALEAACACLARWHSSVSSGLPWVSINVPGAEFHRQHFPDVVAEAIGRHAIPGEKLVLELTERSILSDLESTARTMARVRDLGVRIAMDDFGTGYSSIAYLTRLPITKVKIDKSLIADIESDAAARALVKGIVYLAKGQGLKTVAEGVEREAQLEFLCSIGCELVQGYLLGRPDSFDHISLISDR